jgi:hypothetical protein
MLALCYVGLRFIHFGALMLILAMRFTASGLRLPLSTV